MGIKNLSKIILASLLLASIGCGGGIQGTGTSTTPKTKLLVAGLIADNDGNPVVGTSVAAYQLGTPVAAGVTLNDGSFNLNAEIVSNVQLEMQFDGDQPIALGNVVPGVESIALLVRKLQANDFIIEEITVNPKEKSENVSSTKDPITQSDEDGDSNQENIPPKKDNNTGTAGNPPTPTPTPDPTATPGPTPSTGGGGNSQPSGSGGCRNCVNGSPPGDNMSVGAPGGGSSTGGTSSGTQGGSSPISGGGGSGGVTPGGNGTNLDQGSGSGGDKTSPTGGGKGTIGEATVTL